MIRCEECRCLADDADEGWLTYLVDDEEEPGQAWYFVSYCPSCAFREFRVVPREAYT